MTDPKLRYWKAASRYANAGSIRPAGRAYLNSLREQLGLSAEETTVIETEVLRPYQERLKNLQNYREALVAEAEYEYPLSEEACEEMNRLRELWGLRDEDILSIQQGVEAHFFQKSAVYQQHLTEYGQAFTDAIQQGFPLSSQARQGLETLQRSLVLKPEDAAQIEQPLLQQAELKHQEQLRQEEEKRQQQEQAEYENKLRRYEQELAKAIQADYPLKQFALDRLKTFQQELKLKDEDVDRIEQPIRERAEATYQEQLQQQEQAEQQWQTELEQERQAAEYKQKLQRYEQEFTKAIAAQYPVDSFVQDESNRLQQSFELSDEDVARIEAPLVAPKEAVYQQRLAEEQRRKEEAGRELELERQRELEQQRQEQLKQETAEKQRQAEAQERQRREAEQLKEAQRKQSAQTASANELVSEKGVDYTRLRDLLKARQWQEADKETAVLIVGIDFLAFIDLKNFPCNDLFIIDRLWVKHSKGKFGFSIQKKIWQDCGNEKFAEEVGWKKKGILGMNNGWKSPWELTFDISAPKGHLPGMVAGIGHQSFWDGGGSSVHFRWSFLSLVSRLEYCGIE